MQTRTKCKLIDEAFNWHGGQSSPLYSFASTRTVHSEKHRQNLFVEIAKNTDWVAAQKDATRAEAAKLGNYTQAGKRREIALLSKLAGLIADAKIGVEIVSNDQMTAYWNSFRK